MVTLIVPVQGCPDDFIISLGLRLCWLSWDGKDGGEYKLETLCKVDEGVDHRFNDGKVDRQGRLWAGTMPLEVRVLTLKAIKD